MFTVGFQTQWSCSPRENNLRYHRDSNEKFHFLSAQQLSGALSVEKQLHQSPTYRLAGWILGVWFTNASAHIKIRSSVFMLLSGRPPVAALIKTVIDESIT